MSTKQTIVVLGIVLVVFVLWFIRRNSQQWMLSVYGSGQTIMRTDYSSKNACLSAGRSYIADKTAERFDCGYKCTSFDKNDLQSSPICGTVCNDSGCRE